MSESEKENKIRCNMYLDKKSVETLKRFIKGTGLTLSSYLDLIVCEAAEKILLYESLIDDGEIETDGVFSKKHNKKYFNIYEAHRILGLASTGVKNLGNSDQNHLMLSKSQTKKLMTGKWKFEHDKSGRTRVLLNPDKENKNK